MFKLSKLFNFKTKTMANDKKSKKATEEIEINESTNTAENGSEVTENESPVNEAEVTENQSGVEPEVSEDESVSDTLPADYNHLADKIAGKTV